MRRLLTELQSAGTVARRFGLRASVVHFLYRAAGLLADIRTYVGLRLEPATLAPHLAQPPADGAVHRGTATELSAIVADPDMDMSKSFAEAAVARGDCWYVVARDGRVASYLWCSNRRTELVPGLDVRFNDDWAYYYKAFTASSSRGRGHIGLLTAQLLRDVTSRRRRGLVCLVERTNYASLRACEMAGYRRCGIFHVVRARRRVWIWNRPGDPETGLEVVRSGD